jgi:hypothetical protein
MRDAKDGGSAVLVGRVGQDHGDGTFDFAVERWFSGGDAAHVRISSARTPMGDGSFSFNTCGLDLQAGQHLILAAQPGEGVYHPSACSPSANADDPEGARMLADASGVFGPGFAPGTPPPDPTDWSEFVLPGLAGAAFVVILLVAFARRERA